MDKPIEKKKGLALVFSNEALPYWFGGFMAIFILWLIFRDDASTLRVNSDTLSISKVTAGEFNDYIRISGQVHPMTSTWRSSIQRRILRRRRMLCATR